MKFIICLLTLLVFNCVSIRPALNLNLAYENVLPSKVGESSYDVALEIFAFGDGSISAAMNQGHISRIHHVDVKTEDWLFAKRITYLVYGDGQSIQPESSASSEPPLNVNTYSAWIIKEENGKYGMYDASSGRATISCIYDGLKDFSENMAAAQHGDKWGYINRTGDLIINFQFDKAGQFKNGTAAVSLAGKLGYIDLRGTFYQ